MKNLSFILVLSLLAFLPVGAQTFDWARIAGDTADDMGKCIVADPYGNTYSTGYFGGKVDFDPGTGAADTFMLTSSGGKDIYVMKLNAAGNLVWAAQMGGPGDDIGTTITLSKSGYLYAMGSFNGAADLDPGTGSSLFTSAGLRDISICKLDTSGKLIWAKSIGGIGDDQVRTLALDKNENLNFAGIYYATLDFNPSASAAYPLSSSGWGDVFCCQLDSSGAFKWANAHGGVDSDECYGIAVDSANSVYISGRFQRACDFDPGAGNFTMSPVGLLDGFLVKYNSSGSFAWAKQFGGAGSDITGFSMVTTKLGEVYMAAAYKGTIDIDPGAATVNITPLGKHDICIAKFDTAGNYQWNISMGGPSGDDYPSQMVTDKNGNLYTTGYFYGTTGWNSGTTGDSLTSKGSWDVIISALNKNGQYLWAKSFGGYMFDTGTSLAVDDNGNVYTTGGFQQACDFDTDTAVIANQTSKGKNDIFVHKLIQNETGIGPEIYQTLSVSVFPNPASHQVSIHCGPELLGSELVLSDVEGRTVLKQPVNSQSILLSVQNLDSGIYLLRSSKATGAIRLVVY